MEPKYLISDCDGVLIDSEILAAEVMVEYLTGLGARVSMDEYLRQWSGTTFRGILEAFSQQQGIAVPADCVKEVLHLHESAVDRVQPIRGTRQAYEQVALPKAVVSNSYKWQVEAAVAFVEMGHLFEDRVFTAEMVARPKPHPDVYLHAAQTLGISPQEVIVVEDSKAGVQAAVAAGMQVIGFTGASHILDGHDEVLRNLGAKLIVPDMALLPQAVAQLGGRCIRPYGSREKP